MVVTLSPEQLQIVLALLRATFPDERGRITEELAHAVVGALPADLRFSVLGEVADLVAPKLHVLDGESERVLDYWIVRAKHTRPGVHAFIGHVPMVRVRVPHQKLDLGTKLGIVYAGDSLRWTHDLAVERLRDGLRVLATKVEHSRPSYAEACREALDANIVVVLRTTPARYLGARFAAVSFDVGLDAAGTPIAYRLEAGMATGESIIDFVSPAGLGIEQRRAWYEPTPFSDDRQWYAGELMTDDKGGLTRCRIAKYLTSQDAPDFMLEASYEKLQDPQPVFPALLTAQAAMRVCAIARKLNRSVPGIPDPIRNLLATTAEATLDWEEKP